MNYLYSLGILKNVVFFQYFTYHKSLFKQSLVKFIKKMNKDLINKNKYSQIWLVDNIYYFNFDEIYNFEVQNIFKYTFTGYLPKKKYLEHCV